MDLQLVCEPMKRIQGLTSKLEVKSPYAQTEPVASLTEQTFRTGSVILANKLTSVLKHGRKALECSYQSALIDVKQLMFCQLTEKHEKVNV